MNRALVCAALALCSCGKSDKPGKSAADNAPTPAVAPTPAPVPPPPPPAAASYATPEAKLKRYAQCWDAFNTGAFDVFSSCFAADAVREQVDSVPDLVAQGAERITDLAKQQRAAFPDLKVTPQLVIVSGNDIAAILYVAGTNTGIAAGQKPTGKPLGVFEAEIATLGPDGTFSHDAIYVDQPTIYAQLGLVPSDDSAAASDAHGAPAAVTLVSHGDATELANKALIEKNLDAVNKKNAKVIEAVAADDVSLVYHGEKQPVAGKKAYARWLEDTLRSTKDGFVDIKGLWTAGDWVVVADVFTGTPSEEVVGKDADPKRIETRVVQFFRLKDGKLAEQHIFANRLKAAVQLGVVDPDQLMKTLSQAATK